MKITLTRIDRDPGKIPVPVKIVKFTGIPTGILVFRSTLFDVVDMM